MRLKEIDKLCGATLRNGIRQGPELYHLQITYELALRCGTSPWIVEIGTTNGAATCVLAEALTQLQGGFLTVVGELSPAAEAHIHRLGVETSIEVVPNLEEIRDRGKPSLVSVGTPELAEPGVLKALQLGARVIVLHDIHTARKFGQVRFLPNRRACDMLEGAPDRDFHDLFRRVGISKTDRGMAVSESRFWSGPPRLNLPRVISEPEVEVTAPVEAAQVELAPRWKGFGSRES